MWCEGLTAPCVFNDPINGLCFRAYVEQLLVSVLRPGDIVVLDNLGSHLAAVVRQQINTAGAKLWFLPPYSSNLNPIEQAFANIDATECANYFQNSGHASVKRETL